MKNKIDKQALREKIQSLSGLSNDDKSQLLALLAEQKKYGLMWEDSKEEAEEVLRDNIPLLREVTEKAILHSSPSGELEGGFPNHILIEGDNLHALTALTYSHEGKVDVIYIDPPYNTGNKDFVYNDSFVDSEDGYRHSKWLSFMEKRLRIAKKLLSDKGVIFISIDDNEQANLKLMCDEVFGERNYLNNFAWVSNITGRQISGSGAAKTWETVLAYSRNSDIQIPLSVNITFAKQKMPDTYKGFKKDIRTDERGEFSIGDTLYNHNRKFNEETRPNLVYSIFYNPQTEEIIPDDIGSVHSDFIEILPHSNGDGKHKYHAWRWSRKKVIEESYDLIALPKSDGSFEMHTRIRDFNSTTLKDLITNISNGDSELQIILGSKKFDYPKSVDLLELLLASIGNKDILILDFFAGSGTTLHATMQLNKDGGHRQCILVTNNENNICEEVTYERNKRVINGYTTPKGVEVPGLTANNLRYYQIDMLPHDGSHQSRKDIAYAMTDLLCIKEGIYDEQKSFGSLPLQGKEKMLRYFTEGNKQMLLIYDSRVIPFIVKEIKQMEKRTNIIKIYIFADGSYPYTADFEEVLDRVTLIAMPYAMDRALKLVLPEKEDKALEVEPKNTEENA